MNEFLNKEDILSKLKINESDLKKMIKDGKFPPPEKKITESQFGVMQHWNTG